jgi:hypothetical protein
MGTQNDNGGEKNDTQNNEDQDEAQFKIMESNTEEINE